MGSSFNDTTELHIEPPGAILIRKLETAYLHTNLHTE